MKDLMNLFLFVFSAGCSVHFMSADAPPKNAFMQHMRAQKFFQINNDFPTKLNENYSVDLNEFDSYEADELEQFPMDSKTSATKKISDKSSLEKKKREKLEFKDTENKISNDELLKDELLNDDKERTNLIGGKTCSINEKGILDVSINSSDIFNLKKYMVTLSPNSIIISNIDDKDNTIIKNIPYENIKLPIETIEETRECWKIKTTEGNFFFCEKQKTDRDIWVTNILKALFCYNTNTLTIENNKNNNSNRNVKIPKESTVDQRFNSSK